MNTDNLTMEEIRTYAKRLPTAVLELIQRTAKSLPEAAQSEFTHNCIAKTKDLVFNHTNTLFYAGLGLVAGELINHLTSFNFFGWHGSLSLGKADELGALGGGLFGFMIDRKEIATRNKMLAVIREEVQRAKHQ
jgi:hypothetical protein